MPEYGRNIQRMVDYLRTIEDPEKRQKNAQAIIELMGVLNPHLKNVEDFRFGCAIAISNSYTRIIVS
jgi:hypothetical protein